MTIAFIEPEDVARPCNVSIQIPIPFEYHQRMRKTDSAKWKSKLLSSSLPLEFEVAKVLAARDFTVTANYPYQRVDAGIEKEFSVDIRANHLLPALRKIPAMPPLAIMIECKQRHPGVTWLFLPNVNRGLRMNWSPAIRGIDVFSKAFLPTDRSAFDTQLDACYKGVEVDVANANVFDTELRHGIAQLQFALPVLLADLIETALLTHPFNDAPFFFTAVIVTNAQLMVAHKSFGTRSVERANDIARLGRVRPYLSVTVDGGPEFRSHLQRQGKKLIPLMKSDGIVAITEARKAAGADEGRLPSILISSMIMGTERLFRGNPFGNIIVCNATHFPELLQGLKREAARLSRTSSFELPRRRAG